MDAIKKYLNDEKYIPEIWDDDGWKLLEQARAEIESAEAERDELRTKLDQAQGIIEDWREWFYKNPAGQL